MKYKFIILSIFITTISSTYAFAQDLSSYQIQMDTRTMEEKYPDVFTKTKANHPDTAYEIGRKTKGFSSDFIGDQGKLQFYLIYAQHLQKLNTENPYSTYRKQFIALYQSINHVNQLIDTQVGYYEQMQSMLIAYAEYSIYEINTIDQSRLGPIDVDKQKKFFIKSIQQKIKTKNQNLHLNNLPNYSKNQNRLAEELKKIDELITDAYSLKVAQVFHYTYY
ncbi:MAG TPA: hypothetical protein VIG94_08575 [Faecalibacter sp.]